jgi:hypothetical protein
MCVHYWATYLTSVGGIEGDEDVVSAEGRHLEILHSLHSHTYTTHKQTFALKFVISMLLYQNLVSQFFTKKKTFLPRGQ